MSRIKRLLIALAVLTGSVVSIGSAAYMLAPPAHAQGCVTGNFYMQNTNDTTFYILGEGHNNPVQQVSIITGRSKFCLVDSGTTNWYEFLDVVSGNCLNLGSDARVYEDGCSDTTPEQWNQTIPGNHEWENRHVGSDRITALCLTTSNVTGFTQDDCSSGNPAMEQWATPGA